MYSWVFADVAVENGAEFNRRDRCPRLRPVTLRTASLAPSSARCADRACVQACGQRVR